MPVVPQPSGNTVSVSAQPQPSAGAGGIVPIPLTGYGSPIDLATGSYVADVLAAGGVVPTGSAAGIIPTLIAAASREIIRYCGRRFDLAVYTEIVTPEGTRQDRGEPATARLGQFPVADVASVLTCRQTALTITNTDAVTNQRASVTFQATGDVEYRDLQYVGLNLSRTASGTPVVSALSFADHPTVSALAAAINALGGGWRAAVAGGTPDLGLLPSAELVGAREPKNAFTPGACLDVFTQPASSYDIDRPTGILRCYGGWGNGWGGEWGFPGDGLGGYGYGGAWGQYRVQYTAGFATIPEAVAQVCAEVVKNILARLSTDPSLKSETTGNYSYVARDALGNLSSEARATLTLYKGNFF